ncbi:unnamed protein product [Protopolystoma xenopodis]|uniref:Dynein heavy chain AAA lid domain-containing protein n=1 Tax=Protopolystoma xenopodis TaxID=117903 RepID=A0A3S5CEZ6_9PLAT|nr:unnamed protein product [Protopolystoma xenopodis]
MFSYVHLPLLFDSQTAGTSDANSPAEPGASGVPGPTPQVAASAGAGGGAGAGSGAAASSVGFHERFRLWVTTEEHPRFPINFLQRSVKFTNEPPEGIKANLRRTYSEISQDQLDICVTYHWKIMLYALAFMHCTVQERRKYGPMGWSIPYEYNQSDFNACLQFIQNHLDNLEFKKSQKSSVSVA